MHGNADIARRHPKRVASSTDKNSPATAAGSNHDTSLHAGLRLPKMPRPCGGMPQSHSQGRLSRRLSHRLDHSTFVGTPPSSSNLGCAASSKQLTSSRPAHRQLRARAPLPFDAPFGGEGVRSAKHRSQSPSRPRPAKPKPTDCNHSQSNRNTATSSCAHAAKWFNKATKLKDLIVRQHKTTPRQAR